MPRPVADIFYGLFLLKGAPSNASSRPKNVENVQTFSFAGIVWWFYQYVCNRRPPPPFFFFFTSNWKPLKAEPYWFAFYQRKAEKGCLMTSRLPHMRTLLMTSQTHDVTSSRHARLAQDLTKWTARHKVAALMGVFSVLSVFPSVLAPAPPSPPPPSVGSCGRKI